MTFPPDDVDALVERNAMGSVTWICSFVSYRWTWSLFEGPHPEAVRRAAGAGGLQVRHVDESAGKIFCLVEGPDEDTVRRVHEEALGLVADEVYAVGEYS